VYQDVSNMGQGFRLHIKTYSKINPLFQPAIYNIKLKKNVDVKQFENDLQKRLGETIAIDPNIEERIAQMGVIDGIKTALITLSIFFIAIMLLSIGSDIVVTIKENRKTFAVLTSIGWTPKQVRMSMVYKVTVIILLAVSAGTPLAMWLSPLVMSHLTAGVGLVNFPLVFDYIGMAIVFPLTVVWISMCAWWLSKPAAYSMPRVLMTS
jgi:ABC-type lipoprotein release transport system permease subunit